MRRYDLRVLNLFGSVLLAGAAAAAAEQTFSHDDWTGVLSRFVDSHGLVNYDALADDRAAFDRYIAAVETTSPKSNSELFPSRNHTLAYYINAYNALVFKGVLARGPERKSVWRGAISGLKFFVMMKVVVGGESMSLKALEDKIVRAQFSDPRIHAALNCASISCPRLPRQAFEAASLDASLDAAMQGFVSESTNVTVDADSAEVLLHLATLLLGARASRPPVVTKSPRPCCEDVGSRPRSQQEDGDCVSPGRAAARAPSRKTVAVIPLAESGLRVPAPLPAPAFPARRPGRSP